MKRSIVIVIAVIVACMFVFFVLKWKKLNCAFKYYLRVVSALMCLSFAPPLYTVNSKDIACVLLTLCTFIDFHNSGLYIS